MIPASNEKISINTRTGQAARRGLMIRQDCSLLLLLTTTNAIPVCGNMGTKFLWALLMLLSALRLTITGRFKSGSTAELLYTKILLSRQHSASIIWRKAVKTDKKISQAFRGNIFREGDLLFYDTYKTDTPFIRVGAFSQGVRQSSNKRLDLQ